MTAQGHFRPTAPRQRAGPCPKLLASRHPATRLAGQLGATDRAGGSAGISTSTSQRRGCQRDRDLSPRSWRPRSYVRTHRPSGSSSGRPRPIDSDDLRAALRLSFFYKCRLWLAETRALLPTGFEQGALARHRMERDDLVCSGDRRSNLADNELVAAPVQVNLRHVAEEHRADDRHRPHVDLARGRAPRPASGARCAATACRGAPTGRPCVTPWSIVAAVDADRHRAVAPSRSRPRRRRDWPSRRSRRRIPCADSCRCRRACRSARPVPARITTMRSDIASASSRSCVT